MRLNKLIALLLFCLAVLGGPAIAEAQISEKTQPDVTELKGGSSLRITRPGSYKLVRTVTVNSGDAFIIAASNVTLDLNGHAVLTSSAGNGRGIVIDGGKNVTVKNGKVHGFKINVAVLGGENVDIDGLQITGDGLAPDGGPSEIGILIVNSRASSIQKNSISSVNLGIFVRGAASTGNRITENTIVGGAVPSHNIFGICYNPAEGQGDDGPRGDVVFQNQIARFGFAISISTGSVYNTFRGNNLAGFNGGFRDTSVLTDNGGTNVSLGNVELPLPADTL